MQEIDENKYLVTRYAQILFNNFLSTILIRFVKFRSECAFHFLSIFQSLNQPVCLVILA